MKALFILILFAGFSARAEIFVCNGEGRFAAVKGKQVEVSSQKQGAEIFRSSNDIVSLEVDDANSDGTHYLKILVASSDGHTRIAKASRREMVMYIDQLGNSVDVIGCLPIPGT